VADAVIDASVWVSRFVTHDPHHAASARWLATTTASEGLLAAPTLVLPEVAGPIARITGVVPMPYTSRSRNAWICRWSLSTASSSSEVGR
jgi:predicted nucleic acid-binding protein